MLSRNVGNKTAGADCRAATLMSALDSTTPLPKIFHFLVLIAGHVQSIMDYGLEVGNMAWQITTLHTKHAKVYAKVLENLAEYASVPAGYPCHFVLEVPDKRFDNFLNNTLNFLIPPESENPLMYSYRNLKLTIGGKPLRIFANLKENQDDEAELDTTCGFLTKVDVSTYVDCLMQFIFTLNIQKDLQCYVLTSSTVCCATWSLIGLMCDVHRSCPKNCLG